MDVQTGNTTFAVLGPLRVDGPDGADLTPSGALQRRMLSALLLHRGQVVSADRLTEAMWGSGSIPDSPAALHSHVSRLRKRIPGLAVEFVGNGYQLVLGDDALDVARFSACVSEAAEHGTADPGGALVRLDEALVLWRGRPYADLDETDDGFIEIERLTEIRTRAEEERFAALVALGRGSEAVADLEALVAREPLRERPRSILMDALAAAGRRADALRVYDAYRRALADELGVAPSPEIRSKHDQLLALDDVVIPVASAGQGAATETGSISIPSVLPPRPISALLGRDDELPAIAGQVLGSRLVSLIGPGGVGKTRLAVEVAHVVVDRFDDGVVFCDLTAVPTGAPAAAIADVVGSALHIEQRAGVHPADRLAEMLRHSSVLVVLDNCEHLLDGAAELVERLLGGTERVTVLATSRERLAVDGETLVGVGPLSCDSDDGVSAARELFLDRARAVGAVLGDDDGRTLDELCRRLDGLPLAIELAATRLRSLTLSEVSDGLRQSMSVLSGGRRTVHRHRSLEAALDWSLRLLTEDEMLVLGTSSAFVAPFEAGDVAALLDRPEHEVRERLADLVDRSLVSRVGDRFGLLETVRSFVRHRQPTADLDSLRRRHARLMSGAATEASGRLRTADDDGPIKRIRQLLPELREAFATAVEHRDADLAIDIVVATRDLALAAMLPEPMTWGEQAGELGALTDHPLTADVLAIAALGHWKMGDLVAMRDLLDRAVAEGDRLRSGDRYEVLGSLGTEDLAHGELERAADRLARSLQVPEAIDDVLRLAEGGATLAIIRGYAHDGGANDVVAHLLEDVEPRSGAVPRAWCWYAAGECALDSDPALARERLQRAVDLARRSGATFVEGISGASLASVAVRTGQHEEAIEHYRWLLPAWLRAGVRAPFWTMLRSVIELLVAAGIDEPAARLLGAVTAPEAGNEVIGDDDRRLRDVEDVLRRRLGHDRFEEHQAAGRALDDAAAAAEATAAFDDVR